MATKKRLKKRGQVAPTIASKTRASENNSQSHSIVVDEGKSSLIATSASISRVRQTTPIEECPNKEVEEIEEKKDEENNIKDHEVSSPEVVTSHLHDRPERNDITKKSFSEKIIHYLSSKMNQINPDPIHQLEVLQSSGDVVNLPKTNTVDHV